MADAISFVGSVMLALAVALHPFLSVTVTLYDPATSPLGSSSVEPLLHKYVYGAVPPLTVKLMFPSLSPLHNNASPVADACNKVGCVIVAPDVVVQLLASVIVTLYAPGANPLISLVVAPLLHKYVYGAVPLLTVKTIDPLAAAKQVT